MLTKLYLRWKFRDQSIESLASAHSMLIKFARRCAYDLSHAVGGLPRDDWTYKIFKHRADFWLKIFSPDGLKDYRVQIFDHMERIERENKSLREELRAAGIEPQTRHIQPF